MIPSTTELARDRGVLLGLFLGALVLFCSDLNGVPLRDWDEGTVAQVAREISRGESWTAWVYPQLWGQPYLNKPPLLHSLIAIAYRLGGVHTWTARLPGALLSACSVPLLFLLGRELFRTQLPALLGALVYLTLLPVVRHGRLAMLDGAVVCFFIITLWLLMKARRQPQWHFGVGIGVALMVLTKGMLGLLLLAIALGFLLWDNPKQVVSARLWQGLLLGSLPIIGWYGLQWQHHGTDFLTVALGRQSLNRIWMAVEDHHGPPWYYLLELVKYSWPWLIVWPTGLWLTGKSRHCTWARLLLVWTVGYGGTLSVMSTKLPWYLYPIYPAIALTCGVALTAAWNMHRHWSGRTLALKRIPPAWGMLLALISFISLAGVVYASPWGGAPSFWLGVTFATTAIASGLAARFALRQQIRFIPTLIGGMYVALMALMLSDVWLWELGEDFPVQPVAALIQQHVPTDQSVYCSHPYERPSLNFYSDRRVIPQTPDELITRWQTQSSLYLLLDQPAAYSIPADTTVELGVASGWHLLQKRS